MITLFYEEEISIFIAIMRGSLNLKDTSIRIYSHPLNLHSNLFIQYLFIR